MSHEQLGRRRGSLPIGDRSPDVAGNRVRNDLAPWEVLCLHSLPEVARWRPELAAVSLASRRRDPFSTLEYLETYLRNDEQFVFGLPAGVEAPRPWFLIALVDGVPVAYLPLRLVQAGALGLRSPTLEFMVSHDCDRPGVVAAPADEARATHAFISYLLERRREWTALRFRQQDESSSLRRVAPAFRAEGLFVHERPSSENYTLSLKWKDVGGYYRALSRNQRNGVARNVRRLLGAGAVRYLSSGDPACTPALLELYASIEPRSWKARARGTITRHGRRLAHFRDLLAPSQPLRLRIDLLTLEQTPIAGMITGCYGGRLYGLQMVYDAGLRALGPGSLMLLLAVGDGCAEGLECFNLLAGSGHYKTRWLAEARAMVELQVVRPLTASWFSAITRGPTNVTSPPASEAFNPQRRALEREPLPPVLPSITERRRWRALLEQAMGRCRVLDNDALAARMPFRIGSVDQDQGGVPA